MFAVRAGAVVLPDGSGLHVGEVVMGKVEMDADRAVVGKADRADMFGQTFL